MTIPLKSLRMIGYLLLAIVFFFVSWADGYSFEESARTIERIFAGALVGSWFVFLLLSNLKINYIEKIKNYEDVRSGVFAIIFVSCAVGIILLAITATPASDELISAMQFSIAYALTQERIWLVQKLEKGDGGS